MNKEEFSIIECFPTRYGKQLAENYVDLGTFVMTMSTLPKLISSRFNIFEFFLSGEIIKIIEKKDRDIDKEELAKIKSFLSSINELLENNKDKSANTDIEKFSEEIKEFEELHIPERINAYYILALYAYLETYSKEMYKELISLIPPEQLNQIHSNKSLFSNPYNTMEVLLRTQPVSNSNLHSMLDNILKKASWIEK